ncbi:hypothetical protein POM88_030618 [Heracleum sosnowskyi]|uniref:Bulb-type lectin domain-containing protein n=1 Tax=Heracleum sosnowskyi TaxID=360622 RepID=A0AAD8HYW0_9APIA|nr:hypothetical protein POM88_030618 [Heracleum sosnowskyi]
MTDFVGEQSDILEFWKTRSCHYPVMAIMARDILTVQASTVASESAFSFSGRILNERRSRLSPSSLEVCICYKDHLDAEERIQDVDTAEDSSSSNEEFSTNEEDSEVGVNDTTSVLKLTSSGTLNLYNNTNGVIIWSSDSKRLGVNPVLQLFDNGNLVVREKNDNDPAHYLWQSFDYPTDTHLPGMKLGMDGFETSGSLASTYHGWAAVAVAVLVVENLIAALLQPAFNAQHFSSFQCYLT